LWNTILNIRDDFQDVAGYIFDPKLQDKGISQMLCLPISVTELVSHTNKTVTNSLKFFVMDCRPAEQYNAGHLPIAFPLDSTLVCTVIINFIYCMKSQTNTPKWFEILIENYTYNFELYERY